MKTKCTECERECTLGINAITTSQGDKCDKCANIVRGLGGFAFDEQRTASGLYCICLERDGDDRKCPIHGAQ